MSGGSIFAPIDCRSPLGASTISGPPTQFSPTVSAAIAGSDAPRPPSSNQTGRRQRMAHERQIGGGSARLPILHRLLLEKRRFGAPRSAIVSATVRSLWHHDEYGATPQPTSFL